MDFAPGPRKTRIFTAIVLGLAVFVSLAGPAAAQKKKKDKKAPATDASPADFLNDQQQIDYTISEVLGAWQVGDVERMHKDYVEDVSIVNGNWAPPIIGWANYAAQYKRERDQMQQVRMDRENTYIHIHGDTAWACYQWDFSAIVNGAPRAARGLTTLILVKADNKWKIAHDHTSVVQTSQPQTPGGNSTPAPQQPSNPNR